MKNLKLTKKIKESGLKKVFIAEKVGVDPGVLSHFLSGRMNATEAEKKSFAKVLKCKVEEIF